MSDYEVDVLINGKPIKQFRHKGKRFIEGRKGSNFEIRFKNNTWRQVEVVTSVDGLSVINGKPCGTESDGYLVPANESIIIPGWRLNNDAVAKFVFNDKDRSYTAQMGHGKQNAGVIGFMVFEEEYSTIGIPIPIIPYPQPQPHPVPVPDPIQPWPEQPWRRPWHPWEPYWRHQQWTSIGVGIEAINVVNNDSLGNSMVTGSSLDSDSVKTLSAISGKSDTIKPQSEEIFSLGTGWGSEQTHHVNMVDFNRNDPVKPNKLLVLYYDSRQGLTRRGIKVTKNVKRKSKSLPNPFPTHSESGATPPPGWKNKKRR